MSPKGKRRLEFKPQKPLKGKKVYLDLQGYRKRDSLVHQIKDLGGVSRSINTFIKTTHNTSENDPRSYEVTSAVTNEAQKKIWGSKGIRTHDLHDTGASSTNWAMKPRWKQIKFNLHVYLLLYSVPKRTLKSKTQHNFKLDSRWRHESLFSCSVGFYELQQTVVKDKVVNKIKTKEKRGNTWQCTTQDNFSDNLTTLAICVLNNKCSARADVETAREALVNEIEENLHEWIRH